MNMPYAIGWPGRGLGILDGPPKASPRKFSLAHLGSFRTFPSSMYPPRLDEVSGIGPLCNTGCVGLSS